MLGRKAMSPVLLLSNCRAPNWQLGSWGEIWAGARALEVNTELEIMGADETLEGHVWSEKAAKDRFDIEGTEQPAM